MPKVALIEAGSAVFARQVMTEILAIQGPEYRVFALVDIDPDRTGHARSIAQRLVELTGRA